MILTCCSRGLAILYSKTPNKQVCTFCILPAIRKGHRHFLPIPLFYVFSECFRQYRIILSADTASEVRQMPSQKRR